MRFVSTAALSVLHCHASIFAPDGFENDGALSLLQLRAEQKSSPHPDQKFGAPLVAGGAHGLSDMGISNRQTGAGLIIPVVDGIPARTCELWGDVHVSSTFARDSRLTGDNYQQMPDFNHVSGIVPLAKSTDGSIEMQAFLCPVARVSGDNWGKVLEHHKFGFTEMQAVAIKSGDDVIEIAYEPFEIETFAPAHWGGRLSDPTRKVMMDDYKNLCGVHAGRDVERLFSSWDYYVYNKRIVMDQESNDLLDRDYYAFMLEKTPELLDGCDTRFMRTELYPVVYVNGNRVYSFNPNNVDPRTGFDAASSRANFLGLDLGNGHRLIRYQGRRLGVVSFKITKDDAPPRDQTISEIAKWQFSWYPTAQKANPVAGDYDKWQYFDPMWKAGVWIDDSLLPDDGADSETLCGTAPVGDFDDSNHGNNPSAKVLGLASDYPITQIPAESSLFSANVFQQLCHTCNWNPGVGKTRVTWKDHNPIESTMVDGKTNCAVPPADPDPPPSPPPPQVCEDSDVPLAEATAACSHLTEHEIQHNTCIMDYCVSGGNPEVPIQEELVAEEVDPIPECVGSECDPKTECSDDLQLNLAPPTHSNLGGLGPDSGRAALIYGNVLTVNGRSFDLVVTDVEGTYKASKPGKNGVTGMLGQIGIKAGSAALLDFQIVDSLSKDPYQISDMAFTVLDLDTGKKGKGAESVEVCGSNSAMVSDGTELSQQVANECTKFTATTVGSGTDNPSSPVALNVAQAARAATFGFTSLSSFRVKFESSKGWGQRLFLFAFHPGVACLGA